MARFAPARLIVVGAALTILGLVVASTAPVAGTTGAEQSAARQSAGGIAVLLGWLVLGWGIHRLGREGGKR